MANGLGGFTSALGQFFTGMGQDQEHQRAAAERQQALLMQQAAAQRAEALQGAQIRNYESEAAQRAAVAQREEQKRAIIAAHAKQALAGDQQSIAAIAAVAPEMLGTLTREPQKGTYDSDRGVIVNPDGTVIRPKSLPPRQSVAKSDPVTIVQGVGEDGRPRFFRVPKISGDATEVGGIAPKEGAGAGRANASIKKAIAANQTQLSVIDDALRELDAHPSAVGLNRALGDVPLMGKIGDAVNQRADDAGVNARASISNIGSMVIHDRSGSAVTVSEFPRLAPFVPSISDTPSAIRHKLAKLRHSIETETSALGTQAAPSGPVASAPQPSATSGPVNLGKPTLHERVQQLKTQGVSREQAMQTLQREGYDLHGGH